MTRNLTRDLFHHVIRSLRRKSSQATLALPLFALLPAAAHSQTMVQVPFGNTVFGVPASTYNGYDGQPCTSLNPNYLDFEGDGCPANQAILNYPLGVAIDTHNNLYVAEYGDKLIRVVYQGGSATAAMLVAANPKYSFTPTPGSSYPIGGYTATLTAFSGVYYCNNVSGATALDKYGDGCPAQYSYDDARAVAVDKDGNLFIAGIYPTNGVRIVYAGGAAGAKLITTYNASVTAPQIGYIYPLSASGDFSSIRDIFVDNNENIYSADSAASQTVVTGLQAATDGNQVKKFSGTGWTTFLNGASTATVLLPNGDGGPVAAALTNVVQGVSVDAYGNVYFIEAAGRLRVVYNSAPTPPLYIQGANAVVVTSPTPGFVYSVVGGGTSRTSGSLASSLNIAVSGGTLSSYALDASGNLYFTDSQTTFGYTWREDAHTGIATIIGGGGASSAAYSAAATPKAGVPCNGAAGGPLMTSAFDDGCPATEILPYTPRSRMVFDTAGNYYQIETRVSSQNDGILRKYTFTNQFPATATGSTATAALAFTPTTAVSLTPTPNYLITGDATSEFTDAGSDLCSTSGTLALQTCVYNATFKPALAGPRQGALTLTAAGASIVTAPIGGTGIAAQLTLDPATITTIGTALSPTGTGVDQGNIAYVADATTGNLYKSIAGAAPTVAATGFKNPAQVAIDNSGNVFVADTGNNRIAVAVNTSLPNDELLAINALTLSGPFGVATDSLSNLYIADSGNNRVLKITPLGGTILQPFTGLAAPRGLAVDAAGDIFLADTGNARILELPVLVPGNAQTQTVLTVSPAVITPVGVALDPAGNLYIADSGNQNVAVVPAGSTTATILYGDTTGITGLAVDTTGDVFLSATSATGLIKLNRTNITATFPDTNVAATSTKTLTLNSTGNSALVLGSTLGTGTDTTDFSTGATSTGSCSTAQSLAPGQACAVLATFKPQSKTNALQSTVTFASNAADAATALLIGNGVQKTATTTTVTYTTTTGGQPIAGQPFTVTATISAAAGTGSVIFTIDGMPLPSASVVAGKASIMPTLAAGSHTITATYSGDTTYTGSAGALTVVAVAPIQTSITFITNPTLPGSTNPFTITATITPTPTQGATLGTVTFTVNGVTPAQAATVSAATPTTTFTLTTGKYTITATYSGNPYYIGSTVTQPVQVVPAGTASVAVIAIPPTPANPTFGNSISVQATVTTGNATAAPTGSVTYTVDNGTLVPSQTQTVGPPFQSVSTATFNLLPAGTHTITAMYSGDNNYAPGTGTFMVTIGRATPSTTLTVTPNVSASGNSFTIVATISSPLATPAGSVTLTVGGVIYGPTTLTSTTPGTSTATFLTSTNVLSAFVFSAAYSGDTNFLPETFTTTPSSTFITAIQTPAVTVPQYGVALDYVTLNAFYNYTGNVTITCSTGLPANTLCRPTPVTSTVAANSTATVQIQVFPDVNATEASNTNPFNRTHAHDGSSATYIAGLGIAALSLFLLLPISRRNRTLRRLSGLSLSLLILAATLGISGCGSNTDASIVYPTPTGTYAVTVTATDGTTTSSAILTLTIIPGSAAPRP